MRNHPAISTGDQVRICLDGAPPSALIYTVKHAHSPAGGQPILDVWEPATDEHVYGVRSWIRQAGNRINEVAAMQQRECPAPWQIISHV